MSTEFIIARPSAIPSDGTEHKVTIGSASFLCHLQHECVPSKNSNVFLVASTRNSSSLPFLPGEAAIFFDGNFIAKSQFKAIFPDENFSVSLGQDALIKIDYKPALIKREEIGKKRCHSNVHEQTLIVKNMRNEKVFVTIKENVPRSTDETIEVKLLNPPALPQTVEEGVPRERGFFINSSTNNLEWTIEISEKENKELTVKYQIDYPKRKRITIVEKC